MTNIGLDKMEAKAVFRRSLDGKLEDIHLIDCIANAVGKVIEENNEKLWERFQEVLDKR